MIDWQAIDVWIGVCMIMVFGALLEFTLVNWMANKKMVNSTLPECLTLPRCVSETLRLKHGMFPYSRRTSN